MSNLNSFQESAALSRSRKPLFNKKYDQPLGGRTSPVFKDSTYRRRSSSTTREERSSNMNSSSMKHPAARTLAQRSTSVEKLFPLRPMRNSISKDDIARNASYNSVTTASANNDTSSHNITGSTGEISRLSGESSNHNHNFNSSRLDSTHYSTDYSNNSGRSTSPFQNGDSLYTTEDMSHLKLEHQKQLQELKLDFQAKLLAKDREWDKKLQACKSELASTQETVHKLNRKCQQMSDEHEKSMSTLFSTKNKRRSFAGSSSDLVADLTSYEPPSCVGCEDLKQTEKDYTELHKRFDKLRATCNLQKKSEEKLKEQIAKKHKELEESVGKFEKLKEESQNKLSKAAEEVDRAKRACKTEIMRLQMALKKVEVHSHGVQSQLDQKTKENEELTTICDNLIAIKSTV